MSTAAIVVEIVSADDERYEEFAFSANRGVAEVMVADPSAQGAGHLATTSGAAYEEAQVSMLLGVTADDLASAIARPDETE